MIKALRTFRVRPSLPAELGQLTELAHNLRWAWHAPTRDLFRWAEPDAFEQARGNPIQLLGLLSPRRLNELRADPTFLARVDAAHTDLQRYLSDPRWAQTREPVPPRVAYLSPEFGLTHTMQTYSGGLGVLAGDHLKAASDLGLDMVGVGLLYRHGYFAQLLDADGWQQERYPDLNPFGLPLRRLESDGEPLTVSVDVAEHRVDAQIWLARVGRVPLLLLDTDVASNAPEVRTVTDKLYGGDNEHRLRQEIVLGIGGIRALQAALEHGHVDGPVPEVFHSNEGHAAFSQLERIRQLVADGPLSFDEAVEAASANVLFTTHTPVPAGIDVFPRELMERHFTAFAADCGISLDRLMAVGQIEPTPGSGEFNMAVMALRLSAAANGVSQLHGHVARAMFASLWPGLDTDEVPITAVTNGVHAPTWMGPEMSALFDRYLPADWRHSSEAWQRVGEVGDEALWRSRGAARERLIHRLRAWVRADHGRRGETAASLSWIDDLFDPETLTIGFARRFAEYKRGTLLLRQPERLRALLTDPERPVQIVFAGKAHPRDDLGKGLIRDLVHVGADPALRTRLVFAEDYDIELASALYQGVDLWLNTPRRPHEACGTSGQKAVLNGALHCSTLDGWWDELYDGENGFVIGDAKEHGDTTQQDAADAHSLFDVLERTVVPMFYDRSEGALPRRWLARVRRSLETLGPEVLAVRMVRDYTERLYAPLAARGKRLNADDHKRARALADWRRRVGHHWHGVRIGTVSIDQDPAQIGDRRRVTVDADLAGLHPDEVRAQLLHGPVRADGELDEPTVLELEAVDGPDGSVQRFAGVFDCTAAGEYGVSVRIVAAHEDLLSWRDTALVAWAGDSQ